MIDGMVKETGRFTLHDGSDEAKTDELHEFLGTADWDGDESGVYIRPDWSIRARVGDTIVRGENFDGDRVFTVVQGSGSDKRVKIDDLTVSELMVIIGALGIVVMDGKDERVIRLVQKIKKATVFQVTEAEIDAAEPESVGVIRG